jgi:Tol biopolymer transport system component
VKRLVLAGGLVAAVALAVVPSADAALVFSRFSKGTMSVWIANDNGTGAHKLANNGSNPLITSDGQTVFFQTSGKNRTDLMRVPAAGGTPTAVVRGVQYGVQVVSPNGGWVAITTGPLNGAQKLTLLNVATGATRTVATGYFYGASFSPDSSTLAYSRARSQDFKAPNDVYLAAVAGGTPTNLTNDGHSAYPVWGPTQIAFSRWKLHYGPKHAESGPAYNISVINPDGSGRRNVTNNKIRYLLFGLTATAWSADGQRLLAQFGGQDYTHPVGIEVGTGKQYTIGPDTEFGMTGSQLSADGQTVLGTFGPPEAPGNVVTIPFTSSGRPHVIVRKAGEPMWSAP